MLTRALVRTPIFVFIASHLFFVLGNGAGNVAVSWWITQNGGAADLSTYAVTMSVAMIAAMLVMAPLADRVERSRLIAIAMAVLAGTSASLAWTADALGYRLDVLIAIELASIAVMGFSAPATNSLVADVASPSNLQRTLGWLHSAQSIGRLVGPALGGAVVAAAGTAPALWLNSGLLLVSAVIASRVPRTPPSTQSQRRHWWAEITAGLRVNWSIPLERGWMASNFISWMFLFPALTLLVPLKVHAMGLSSVWLGLCEGALALGALAGTLGLAPRLIDRFGRYRTRLWSAVVQGLALAAIGLTSRAGLLVLLFALVGFSNAAVSLVGMTHRTLARPREFRARMSAGSIITSQVAAAIGPALAGLALTRWPVHGVYFAFGLAGGIAALSLAAVPGFRAFMAIDHDAVDGWYERAHPEVFVRARS